MILLPIIHLCLIFIIFKIGKIIKDKIKSISEKQNQTFLKENESEIDKEIKEINKLIEEMDTIDNLAKINKLKRKKIILEKKRESENRNNENKKNILTLKDNIFIKLLLLACENQILTSWIITLFFSNYSYEFKFNSDYLWPIESIFGYKSSEGKFIFKFTFLYGIICIRFLNCLKNIFV